MQFLSFLPHRKVLKEIPVGGLEPNETVLANQEAQLLSQLHHPAILKFYSSFLERDSFCIITEYCEVSLFQNGLDKSVANPLGLSACRAAGAKQKKPECLKCIFI